MTALSIFSLFFLFNLSLFSQAKVEAAKWNELTNALSLIKSSFGNITESKFVDEFFRYFVLSKKDNMIFRVE